MPIIAASTSRVNIQEEPLLKLSASESHVRISHSVLSTGTSGEAVCQAPFNPGMPIYLL